MKRLNRLEYLQHLEIPLEAMEYRVGVWVGRSGSWRLITH